MLKISKFIYEIYLSLLIIIFISYSLIGINIPWSNGHHGFIGGEKSRPAIYYLELGYLKTKFGQLAKNNWRIGKETYIYNVHHPVGLPLLISLRILFDPA